MPHHHLSKRTSYVVQPSTPTCQEIVTFYVPLTDEIYTQDTFMTLVCIENIAQRQQFAHDNVLCRALKDRKCWAFLSAIPLDITDIHQFILGRCSKPILYAINYDDNNGKDNEDVNEERKRKEYGIIDPVMRDFILSRPAYIDSVVGHNICIR